MRNNLLLSAAVVAVLAISGRADDKAEDRSPNAGIDAAALFGQLDINKDGQIAADEIPAERKRLFERLLRQADKNGDGKLSAEEFAAGLKAPGPGGDAPASGEEKRGDGKRAEGDDKEFNPRKMFQRLDANGDGKVTLDEVPEPRREHIKRLIARGDKDGDGALSVQEMVRALREVVGKPGGGPEGAGRAKQLFARFDKNGDGKLSSDEAPEDRKKFIEVLLARGDKDNDKLLSLEEFVAVLSEGRPKDGRPGDKRPDEKQPEGKRPENTPPGRPASRPGFGGKPPFPSLFGVLDTDHDGSLSSAEIGAATETLRKLDKDGDGNVTFAEIVAAGRADAEK